MQAGDVITQINGKKIHLFRDITTFNQFHQKEEIDLTYERNGKETTVHLKPQWDESMGCTVTVTAEGLTQKPGCWRRSAMVVPWSVTGSVRLWKLKDACHGQIGMESMSGPVGSWMSFKTLTIRAKAEERRLYSSYAQL